MLHPMTTTPKILLIEDDPDQILLYQTKFRLEGLEMITAQTGKQGIELARREKPDVIMVDVILGEENGVNVLKNLKGDALTSTIPVVMFSNLDKKQTVDECMQNGAVEYILKTSLEPKDLVLRMKEIIANKK